MSRAPVRRGQLIAPFGVGSMLVGRNGISMIAAGLDHWYQRVDGTPADTLEFTVNEWRLSRQLGTKEFRLPPDFREPKPDVPNAAIKIPFLRFPLTHVCPKCGWMTTGTLTQRTSPRCKHDKRIMNQASLVTICESGHIHDFPWREWVHQSIHPECQQDLYFKSTGSETLSGQKVTCKCGKERSLTNVTFENVLTNSLDPNEKFLCQGKQPWLGHLESAPCSNPVVVALRSSTNVHFSLVQSAIYIPRGGNKVSKEIIEILERPAHNLFIRSFGTALNAKDLKYSPDQGIAQPLADYEIHEIQAAIEVLASDKKPEYSTPKTHVDFRREEFTVLRNERVEDQLQIRSPNMGDYSSDVQHFFNRITLIEKLRETRALYGFTRVVSGSSGDRAELKSRLRRPETRDNWLPAQVVYGEGIFIEFHESNLIAWEKAFAPHLEQRIAPLRERTQEYLGAIQAEGEPISPRSLLIHTFAHVLINQLVFECGYSAASLRERLYVDDGDKDPMAAVLIYTASGDADGTMGGLVRMGEAGLLEPVIRKAIENAAWCSADPVCMEFGDASGQGPSGLNLAACHSCALVPETSCEMFNHGLDRATLVGNLATGGDIRGYFHELLQSR